MITVQMKHIVGREVPKLAERKLEQKLEKKWDEKFAMAISIPLGTWSWSIVRSQAVNR